LDIDLKKIEKGKDNSKVYKELMEKRKSDEKENNNRPKPYISIIIPCYNVENYIDRCMESVTSQTIGIENLQVILINDASPGNTLEKLKEWERKYPDNITLISYDENLRQGGARNIGLCYADAEYIGFVDSDDWIELDMYEHLYKMTDIKKWDLVRGKFIRDDGLEEFVNPETTSIPVFYCEFKKVNNFYFKIDNINDTGKNGEYGMIWTGMYLKEVIIKNDLWFPERIAYEDNFWDCITALYIKNICIVDKILYHYFVNQSSTTRTRNSKHHYEMLSIEIMKLEEYKKRGAFNTFYTKIEHKFIKSYFITFLYVIFYNFDYIPDNIINFLKEKIILYFPNFKNELDLSIFEDLDKMTLRLLYTDKNIRPGLLEELKEVYLKTFG